MPNRTVMGAVLLGAFVALPVCSQLNESPDRQLARCVIEGAETEALCGTYSVYEDREAGEGRTIDLNVVLLKAPRSPVRAEPVVSLYGGPGQGAASDGRRGEAFAQNKMWPDRDVLLIDQRGTGASNPLGCARPADRSGGSARETFGSVFGVERMKDCLEDLQDRADPSFYSTTLAMDDLDEVREWLGYDRVVLMAGSYGTRAAQVYMRRHPDHVAAAILDGVVPMDARSPLGYARDAQAALDRVVAAYEASEEGQAEKAPRLAEDLKSALAGIKGGPVEATVIDRTNGNRFSVRFSQGDFGYTLRGTLYSPRRYVELPWLMQEAARGNWNPFAQRYLDRSQGLAGIAKGMYFSVFCAEDIPFIQEAEIEEAVRGTILGRHLVDEYRAICEFWPSRPVGRAFHEAVATDAPVLLLSGTADPSTPPAGAQEVMRAMTRALHLVIEGSSHGSNGLPGSFECVAKVMGTFVDRLAVDEVDASCLREIPPVRFVTERPPSSGP